MIERGPVERAARIAEASSAGDRAAEVGIEFRVIGKDALSDADLGRMLELLTLAFERWPAVDPGVPAAEHLRWKTSSPAALVSAQLGESGGQLVTTDTCLGYRILLRGRERLRLQFVDHAVRPSWRGRGVSSASQVFRQTTLGTLYDLSITDPQSAVMIQRSRKWGIRPFGNPIRPLVLPLRRREFARRWANARGWPAAVAPALELLARAVSIARRRRPGRRRGEDPSAIVAVERFDDRVDRFFSAASAPYELIVVRSRDHLDWRYCDRRGGPFLKRIAEAPDGALLGYGVASVRGDKGYLVDLLALPGRVDVVQSLAAELTGELERAGCVDVVCWLPERHPYRPALRREGFLDARRRPHIHFRASGLPPEELDFLVAPQTPIHYTLGDADFV